MIGQLRAIGLVAALILSCFSVAARADCNLLPRDVQAYLKSQQGWSVVTEDDLISDDVALWHKYHTNQCPGFTAVALGPGKALSYALALLHRNRSEISEKLIVIEQRAGQPAYLQLVAVAPVVSPFVVWRAPPGIYRDEISRKSTRAPHDAIIYEKMEASATAYYLSDGRFHSVVTSH